LRHGKQLGIVGSGGGCVCVHLGMSGQLCVMGHEQAGTSPKKRTALAMGSPMQTNLPPHTHVVWLLDGGLGLRFTDPRRFGGLWTFADVDGLIARRWSKLGPDALRITPGQLC